MSQKDSLISNVQIRTEYSPTSPMGVAEEACATFARHCSHESVHRVYRFDDRMYAQPILIPPSRPPRQVCQWQRQRYGSSSTKCAKSNRADAKKWLLTSDVQNRTGSALFVQVQRSMLPVHSIVEVYLSLLGKMVRFFLPSIYVPPKPKRAAPKVSLVKTVIPVFDTCMPEMPMIPTKRRSTGDVKARTEDLADQQCRWWERAAVALPCSTQTMYIARSRW